MSDHLPPQAQVFSFDMASPDFAVLRLVQHGVKIGATLGEAQLRYLEDALPRVRRAMEEARNATQVKVDSDWGQG